MESTREMILSHKPNRIILDWLENHPSATPQDLWETTAQGLWMMSELAECGMLDGRIAAQMGCAIVRETNVWFLLSDDRSRTAIEVTEAWLQGKSTIEMVNIAAEEAKIVAERTSWNSVANEYDAAAWCAVDTAARAVVYVADMAIRASTFVDNANSTGATIADIIRRYFPRIED